MVGTNPSNECSVLNVCSIFLTDMVHRDLKLENVLLSTVDPEEEYNIKVRRTCIMYRIHIEWWGALGFPTQVSGMNRKSRVVG